MEFRAGGLYICDMVEDEMHQSESSAIGGLGDALERAGQKPRHGGWLEGLFIDNRLQNAVSEIFSEWLIGLSEYPSLGTTDEYLERLKEMLRPHLTEFQQARLTHDFLADILAKAEKPSEGEEDLDDLLY